MASFGTFVSAQNNQSAPPDKPKTEKELEKELEKGTEKKKEQNEVPAHGTPNQPSENPQNLSDGTKKATIVKSETKKEKGNN